jgi:hypothetical protein
MIAIPHHGLIRIWIYQVHFEGKFNDRDLIKLPFSVWFVLNATDMI